MHEADNDNYTIIKSNYFKFMDSTYQGKQNTGLIAIHHDSREPLQDITPSQHILPRHLTFSETDNRNLVFQPSGQKQRPQFPEKENRQKPPKTEPVFVIEEQGRGLTFEEDPQSGFKSVDEGVEMVVYGDPQSQSKLGFLEKVRKLRENQGDYANLAKYDTLGPPPQPEYDVQKLFTYLPE